MKNGGEAEVAAINGTSNKCQTSKAVSSSVPLSRMLLDLDVIRTGRKIMRRDNLYRGFRFDGDGGGTIE